MITIPDDGMKIPTAKELRESRQTVINKKIGMDAEIGVYQNGYVLYQACGRSTVFPVHFCREYSYMCDGNIIQLPELFFEKESWDLRLVLEGEDRLSRNQEERERGIPYSNIPEEWIAIEDFSELVLEQLAEQEIVKEMLQLLTEKQKTAILRYYVQEKTQMEISDELGVSRSTVKDSIFYAVSKIRKKYSAQTYLFSGRAGYGEIKR